jgi:intraflagellar transport protein 172
VLALLARYGAPAAGNPVPLFRRLAAELLGGTQAQRCPDAALVEAREVLFKLCGALRRSGGAGAAAADELERNVLPGVHFAAMRVQLAELGLPEQAAKAAVSALRLVGHGQGGGGGGGGGGAVAPPADRAYFEAGSACRQAGGKGAALVLLNRFIDLCEAVEEGAGADLSALDNEGFQGSGLLAPADFAPGALPRQLFVAEKAREEAKDWVLATSMDRKVEQALPTRPCLSCGQPVFEGALGCGACRAALAACAITGYPLAVAHSVACGACGSKCAKPAWNAVVSKAKRCILCGAGASQSL